MNTKKINEVCLDKTLKSPLMYANKLSMVTL